MSLGFKQIVLKNSGGKNDYSCAARSKCLKMAKCSELIVILPPGRAAAYHGCHNDSLCKPQPCVIQSENKQSCVDHLVIITNWFISSHTTNFLFPPPSWHLVHDFKRIKWPMSIALPGAGAFQINITFSITLSLASSTSFTSTVSPWESWANGGARGGQVTRAFDLTSESMREKGQLESWGRAGY